MPAKQFTPLPPQRFTPARFVVSDWMDLSANDTTEILDVKQFSGQIINVTKIGARPETSVFIEVETEEATATGPENRTHRHETSAIPEFNSPIEGGPVATDRLVWTAINNSATNFTSANNDEYKSYINYTIREPTIVDQLRRGLTLRDLSGPAAQLAREEFGGELSVAERESLNLPTERDPVFRPNLEGKDVMARDADVTTVDISTSGASNGVTIADERVRTRSVEGRRVPIDIIYLTGIGINSQEFGTAEDINLEIIRDETDNFYRIETLGLPGQGDGQGQQATQRGISFPPFTADVFVPFLNRMTVNVFSPNATPNSVDVRVEFARVRRDLVEKAIYNLENEVRTGDNFARDRQEIFNQIRGKLRAGLSIETERIRADELQAGATV